MIFGMQRADQGDYIDNRMMLCRRSKLPRVHILCLRAPSGPVHEVLFEQGCSTLIGSGDERENLAAGRVWAKWSTVSCVPTKAPSFEEAFCMRAGAKDNLLDLDHLKDPAADIPKKLTNRQT